MHSRCGHVACVGIMAEYISSYCLATECLPFTSWYTFGLLGTGLLQMCIHESVCGCFHFSWLGNQKQDCSDGILRNLVCIWYVSGDHGYILSRWQRQIVLQKDTQDSMEHGDRQTGGRETG